MTTVTSRDFNQDVSAAKRAATDGPVIVTDRGEPAFVLLSYADYLSRTGRTAGDLVARLAMSEEDYVEDFAPGSVALDMPDL